MSWNNQTNAQKHNVYRDGKLIATTTASYVDEGLDSNTEYKYQVQAVGFNGFESIKSQAFYVTTKEGSYTETPSILGNLHTMGVTKTSVSLMWQTSTHSSGIKEYQIYRDGVQVGTTSDTEYEDVELDSGKTYVYQVRAISYSGDKSEFSHLLQVTTDQEDSSSDYKKWKLGSFSSPELYTVGERNSHLGRVYIVLQTKLTHFFD